MKILMLPLNIAIFLIAIAIMVIGVQFIHIFGPLVLLGAWLYERYHPTSQP
jgi:hypothetical protein